MNRSPKAAGLNNLILPLLFVLAFLISLASLLLPGLVSANAPLSYEIQDTPSLSLSSLSSTSIPNCGLAWRTVPIANPSNVLNNLPGVDATDANDAWAVGYYDVSGGGNTRAIHWDGTQWNDTAPINPRGESNLLTDVEAISSSDVWAVGYSRPDGPEQPLIEHWDGSAWNATVIAMPPGAVLRRLSIVSTNDVWAVGYQTETVGGGGALRMLTMHWDGTSWSIIPAAYLVSIQDELWGVSAVSSSDVWAVGLYYDLSQQEHTLAIHWDGSQWLVSPTPNLGHGPSLWAVAAISSEDVWAVGNTGNRGLTLHWDGYEWLQVPSPSPNGDDSYLQGVDAGSANDVWAVGYSCCPGLGRSLILHWDGTMWSISPSSNPGAANNFLFGVSVASANDVWTVGNYDDCFGCPTYNLMERYSDPCLTPTPTVTGTPPHQYPYLYEYAQTHSDTHRHTYPHVYSRSLWGQL